MLTVLRELMARGVSGFSPVNPAFKTANEDVRQLIVAAHRLLTYIADPKAEEELARVIDPKANWTVGGISYATPLAVQRRADALAKAHNQLALLARKAMGGTE
jgi:hypothetical protein